jgi:hypothetical protein
VFLSRRPGSAWASERDERARATSDRSCSAARRLSEFRVTDFHCATTAMRMSFEQAQLGANVMDPLLSRRRWPNGPGTEGHRTRGKRGAPQSACYGHATGGLSAYYPGRISTVTAIFPARIFKILCGFFRPEFSYIFLIVEG